MKKLLILAVMLSALLSVWQVNLVSGSGGGSGDLGTITVHKFHDANRNGVQDPGEEDLVGWLIRIYGWDPGLSLLAEGYTDTDGSVTFEVPSSDYFKFKVWEEQRECWEPTTPDPINGPWEGGYYTVVYSAWFSSTPNIPVEFGNVDNCAPPPPSLGTGTPGYWKNHTDAWPEEEISIGGVTYVKDIAIAHMSTPDKGDKTYTLFRALVAAKLNVAIGNDASCIADTIRAADAWMATYGPVGSGVKAGGKNSPWRDAEPLYEMLDDYNNGLLCAPSRDDLE